MGFLYKLALNSSVIPGVAGLIAFAQMPHSPTTSAHLPKPYATASAKNPPLVIAKPGNAQLHAPSGFPRRAAVNRYNPAGSGHELYATGTRNPAGVQRRRVPRASCRSQRDGYEVAFVTFKNGKPSGPARGCVSGWTLSPSSKDAWRRPVAVLQMPDGSLLVSDDGGGKIWRISHSNGLRG